MAVAFLVRNRLYPGYDPKKPAQYVQVIRRGVKYDLGSDGTVELFKVKIFAEALDRTTLIVKDWIKEGKIPKPLFHLQETQCKNWFSAAQVINCHRIMMGKYGGKKYLTSDVLEAFFADIRSVWVARDVVVNTEGVRINE